MNSELLVNVPLSFVKPECLKDIPVEDFNTPQVRAQLSTQTDKVYVTDHANDTIVISLGTMPAFYDWLTTLKNLGKF